MFVQSSRSVLIWLSLDFFKEFEGRPKINYVTVFERPGLHEFLKQLSEFSDLVLFTAGLEGWFVAFNFLACIFFLFGFWEVVELPFFFFMLTFWTRIQVMPDHLWTE